MAPPSETQALSVLNKKEINAFVNDKCEKAQTNAEKLLRAPEICCMIESLTLFARCAKPINLRCNESQEFIHLRTPESLTASIYQLTNAMEEIFRVSGFSMNLEKIPTYMNECLEALENPNGDDSQEIIEWAIPGIHRATTICVDAAKEPYQKCVKALEIIHELHQAVLALQDSKTTRTEKNKEELDKQQRLKEQHEDELNEIKKQLEIQQQNAENARKNYSDTLKNNNEVSLTIFTMIMDNLNIICRGAAAVGQLATGSLYNLHNNKPIISKEGLINMFSEDEEKALFNIMEEIIGQKDEEIQANIQEHITNLKCATDYKPNEKLGRMLRDKGNDLMEALIKMRENGINCHENLCEAKAFAKIFLKTYQETVEIKNRANEEDKQLQAEMSRERQNLMQTRADNLKVAQQGLDSESHHLNSLIEKKESISQAVNNAINKIANLNCEEIDLNEVLECLEEVIQVLTSIQIAFNNIVHYFNYVKELIDGPLITQIQDVTKFIVNEDQTIKSLKRII
uniref:Uncharacterized protein n=1 Tax=Panagrolaimus davidi TaxID=227884 RepID=A0A914Q2G2_9BILA